MEFFYQYIIYFYALTLSLIYIMLATLAYFNIVRTKVKYTRTDELRLLKNPEKAPGISILAGAYNEEAVIVDSVKAFLNIEYPTFEVIIANDGSTDKTLDLLIDNFDLEEVDYPYIPKIHCEPVKRVFKSTNPIYSRLTIVDKENGKTKADAINGALNMAQYDYFINTDVDCILDPSTLTKVILPVLDSEVPVIAVGATMRMANGCEIEDGVMKRVRPPRRIVPLFQETEYLRSYLLAKMGWSALNAIPNVSGGFGLLHTQTIIESGGYDPLSHAEDMDMTLRMIAHIRERGKKYKIVQIPDTCAWTEGPPSLNVLYRQRTRWGRGLMQIFIVHRKYLFNYKYGRVGLGVLPYALIFEFLAPLIELTGFFFFLYLLLTNQVNFNTFWLLFSFIYLMSLSMSVITIVYDITVKKHYKYFTEYLKLVLFATFEIFLYHPFIVVFSIIGYFQFLFQRNFRWGEMTRQGFSTAKDEERE